MENAQNIPSERQKSDGNLLKKQANLHNILLKAQLVIEAAGKVGDTSFDGTGMNPKTIVWNPPRVVSTLHQ